MFVKWEEDYNDIIEKHHLQIITDTPDGKQMKVTGDEQAQLFLNDLIQNNKKIIKFELREPSLHEIFVEKVGNAHEEE